MFRILIFFNENVMTCKDNPVCVDSLILCTPSILPMGGTEKSSYEKVYNVEKLEVALFLHTL